MRWSLQTAIGILIILGYASYCKASLLPSRVLSLISLLFRTSTPTSLSQEDVQARMQSVHLQSGAERGLGEWRRQEGAERALRQRRH